MTLKEFHQFILFLQEKNFQVAGPQEKNGGIFFTPVTKPKEIILDNRMPFYPPKHFFIPPQETILEFGKKPAKTILKQAVVGINILDLKALLLYNHIFEKDPYYQENWQNTLVVGHSIVPRIEDNIFEEKYEEDILEHLQFDIFLGCHDKGFRVFTGSRMGQEILDDFGYKKYEHIQFAGPIKEEVCAPCPHRTFCPAGGGEIIEDRLNKLRKGMLESDPKIWQELGQRCLECGKCTMVCPTCFCFRIDDMPDLKNGSRVRSWDTCFYHDFSEVAGGHKFLKTTAERIHFWYEHKFVRIPNELSLIGCVGCGRCTKVCPVGIDIAKVLEELTKN